MNYCNQKIFLEETALLIPGHDAIEEDTNCLLGVTYEGNKAFHIVSSQGHPEFADKICRQEISLLTAPNKRLDTPLHCAARAGNDKIVSNIIKLAIELAREGKIKKEEVLRATNKNKNNALHEAAKYNHMQVAKVLIEEDTELASTLNDVGMSALYLAIVSGSLEVAKNLLQFSPPSISYQGPNNKTALHAAVLISQEITEEILKWVPTLATRADDSKRLPLHYAAVDGHHDMVKLLLEHNHSAAYQPDANGLFPIHIGAKMGNFRIVDQILEQCPDTDELLDKRGRNFLHVAFQWKKLDLVKKIISKRPDLRKLLNDQDNEGNTPLHTAVENGDQWSVHFLLRDKTVHVNVINHCGFTPLDRAYAKCDEASQSRTDAAEVYIAGCLAFTKAWSGSQILHDLESDELSSDQATKKQSGNDKSNKKKCDKSKKKSSNNEGNKIGRQVNLARNLEIPIVLIAAVTFAAGFTVPGGYTADDHPDRGSAVLAKEYAFKVFLISDTFALVCSLVATCWLMYAGTSIVGAHTRKRALLWSAWCLWVAFVGGSAAFAMGIYVVLPPSCKSISILVCIVTLGAPFFAYMMANSSRYSLLKTVRIRQGYRQCIWPRTHPHVKKCLGHNSSQYTHPIVDLLLILSIYAIFFLLAML